jgi:hypothetical protein
MNRLYSYLEQIDLHRSIVCNEDCDALAETIPTIRRNTHAHPLLRKTKVENIGHLGKTMLPHVPVLSLDPRTRKL